LVALVAVVFGAIAVGDKGKPAINEELIAKINSNPETKWEAGINDRFVGATMFNVKRLLGYKPQIPRPPRPMVEYSLPPDAIPASFDSRTQWPKCDTMSTIYNQAECGSCWAFGAVESISDRFCVQFGKSLLLSFEDMVTCDQNDDGCEGGDAYSAQSYAQTSGLVTDLCSPYTIPTCPPQDQPCLNFVDTPACVQKCVNGTNTWQQDKHFLSNVYGVGSTPSAIQTEIMTNGPVEACFDVYEDFVNYKSGVYHHTSGDLLGGHCIKLLGWGTESSTPYWLAANSWTNYWGANGYFLIERGDDECGIEDDVVAGTPSSQTTTSTSTTSSTSSTSSSSSSSSTGAVAVEGMF